MPVDPVRLHGARCLVYAFVYSTRSPALRFTSRSGLRACC